MDKLNEMREQMQMLHNTLDSQQIVTDNMVRKVMNKKAKSLHRQYIFSLLLVAITLPFGIIAFSQIGLSWMLIAFTCCLVLAELIYTRRSNQGITPEILATDTVANVVRRIIQFKQRNAHWMRMGSFLGAIWIAWLFCEIYYNTTSPESERIGMIYAAGLGATLGCVVGYYLYHRAQKLADDLLNQLHEEGA